MGRAVKAKLYQEEIKERIRAKQKERYAADPEKYRKIHNDYYHKNKDRINEAHKKYYKENIRKPDLFMFEQWLKKKTSGS